MRVHLYEFRNDTRKLKCTCGWERTVKSADQKSVVAAFDVHRDELAAAAAAR